ncbi:MAG: signal peptide peptidase SppA [Pseudomonadota bacterium]
MTATADMILERRRIRRRLTFWRILAIVAILIAAIAMIPKSVTSGDHIARVSIDGVIQDDPDRDRLLRRLVDEDTVRAVIVRINSPGGTVVASEALYEQLRSIAETKPVVAVMTEYAASGGYIASLASDYIIARGNTLTGSIGVLSEVPNIEGLMEMLGVGVTRIKSAPLKAEPSVTEAPSPAALKAQEALIADMYGWFRGLVEERRNLTGGALNTVSDGRAFTGRQALELGLVDVIGDEQTARDWLESEHSIDAGTKVKEQLWGDKARPWPLSALLETGNALSTLSRLDSGLPRLYAIIQ